MALDNVRERLALHFDSEASLKSKVLAGAYEVHIRIPYRSAKDAPAPAATKIAAVPSGATASHG
jgi:two-component system sensor histidine kinase AlgZ